MSRWSRKGTTRTYAALTSGFVLSLLVVGDTARCDPRPTHHAARSIEPALAHTLDGISPGLLREFAAPGAAVALIENGEITWTHGYGVADVTSRTAVTPDTVFNVGSISKTVAAWGVMRLVDRAKCSSMHPLIGICGDGICLLRRSTAAQ
jgi:CubicO group peptidase (beta-lactamase class C family)